MKRDLIARAIIWKNGALLVNQNHTRSGQPYVALPGGHVDAGEHCVEALQREIEEELAAKCEVGEFVFACENFYDGRKPGESGRHELTLFWQARIEGEKTHPDGTLQSPEAWKRFKWLPQSELESANLLPLDVKRFLLGQNAARYTFSDTRTIE